MVALRRHQLAWLTAQGWEHVLRTSLEPSVLTVLREWAGCRLPLVVTRQDTAAIGTIALGWPAPACAARRRVAVYVSARDVKSLGEFPQAHAAVPLLPHPVRPAAHSLLDRLRSQGVRPRVYGSYGWQLLSGMRYIHAASDLDLWMAVSTRAQADAVTALLQAFGCDGLRIDGELLLPDGAAVAWREYAAWRSGHTRRLLVKRLQGVHVADTLALTPGCEGLAA